MLPYIYYKIKAWIKKYEIQNKYNIWKNNLILNRPELIFFILIMEIIITIIFISIQIYLIYIGILAFKSFILLLLYSITGYEPRK